MYEVWAYSFKMLFRYLPFRNNQPPGFTSSNCSQSCNSFGVPQMTTMMASYDLNTNSNRYPNSGATHHLTNNFNNLSSGSEYGGGNQAYATNGSGLPILHYGSTIFPYSNPYKNFVLKISFMFLQYLKT